MFLKLDIVGSMWMQLKENSKAVLWIYTILINTIQYNIIERKVWKLKDIIGIVG
jgi:hypothetical protein